MIHNVCNKTLLKPLIYTQYDIVHGFDLILKSFLYIPSSLNFKTRNGLVGL